LKSKTIHPWKSFIPKDWDSLNLEEVCEKIIDNRGKTVPTIENGIPLIATNCISNRNLYPEFKNVRYVSKEIYKNWFRDHPSSDDIIFVNKGEYAGKVCLVPNPVNFCIAQDMIAIHPNKDVIDPEYLFAVLRSRFFQKQLKAFSVGTLIPHIKKGSFKELLLPIPSRPLQKIIGNTYCNISKKIDNLEKQNKILEEIGYNIFQNWLIDFEFPNYQNKPYQSSKGEMIYNEKLEKNIPKGWDVKPIDEIADFLNGLALQKYPAKTKNYLPVIKIRELRRGITNLSDKSDIDIPSKYIICDGDVLFSWSGSLEVIIWTGGAGALNQHLFKVSSKEYPKWFYYYWIKYYLSEYRNIAEGKATTMGHIQRHHLSESFVVIPNSKTFEKANPILNTIIEKMIQVNVESRKLSQIRDFVLSKFMSGKIRVPMEIN